MDNPFDQIQKQIHNDVHHAVDEAMGSPVVLNRTIGEAMRHIGAFLDTNSTAYLPVRPDEVLCEPIKISEGNEAVLLVNRTIYTDNSFLVLADVHTGGDGVRTIDIFAYKPDSFMLARTKFLKLPEPVGKELIRQFDKLIKEDGNALFQALIAKNYFMNMKPVEDPLYNSDNVTDPALPAVDPVAAPEPIKSGGLPEIDSELI